MIYASDQCEDVNNGNIDNDYDEEEDSKEDDDRRGDIYFFPIVLYDYSCTRGCSHHSWDMLVMH